MARYLNAAALGLSGWVLTLLGCSAAPAMTYPHNALEWSAASAMLGGILMVLLATAMLSTR